MPTTPLLILAMMGPATGPADEATISASPAVDRRVIRENGPAGDQGDLVRRVQYGGYGSPYSGPYIFNWPTGAPYSTIYVPGTYAPGSAYWQYGYGPTYYGWGYRSAPYGGWGYRGAPYYYGSPYYYGRRGVVWGWY